MRIAPQIVARQSPATRDSGRWPIYGHDVIFMKVVSRDEPRRSERDALRRHRHIRFALEKSLGQPGKIDHVLRGASVPARGSSPIHTSFAQLPAFRDIALV